MQQVLARPSFHTQVGLLVAGYDQTGPHLYNTCPSGNYYEYKAMSIGARAQASQLVLDDNGLGGESTWGWQELREFHRSSRNGRKLIYAFVCACILAGMSVHSSSYLPQNGRLHIHGHINLFVCRVHANAASHGPVRD